MTSLADIEKLEHQCVDVMARADTTAVQRGELAETLAKIRALKREYLTAHPAVLRKGSAKLHTAQAERDRPNAPSPDAMLGSDPLAFRAPQDLTGLTIHTVAGMIRVPASGIVEAAAHHVALHSELVGRGFRQLYGVDRFARCATGDPVQMFARAALQPIGGDLLRGLGDRAEKASAVPFETRQENFDGPQPAALYASSCAAFRARYFFGREE